MFKYKILLLSMNLNVIQYIEPFQNGIHFFNSLSCNQTITVECNVETNYNYVHKLKKYYKGQVCT